MLYRTTFCCNCKFLIACLYLHALPTKRQKIVVAHNSSSAVRVDSGGLEHQFSVLLSLCMCLGELSCWKVDLQSFATSNRFSFMAAFYLTHVHTSSHQLWPASLFLLKKIITTLLWWHQHVEMACSGRCSVLVFSHMYHFECRSIIGLILITQWTVSTNYFTSEFKLLHWILFSGIRLRRGRHIQLQKHTTVFNKKYLKPSYYFHFTIMNCVGLC